MLKKVLLGGVIAILAFATVLLLSSEREPDVTYNSDAAYKLYLKGIELRNKFFYEESIEPLEEAVNIDPGFVMARVALAEIYSTFGRAEASRRVLDEAFGFKDEVTERERLILAIARAARTYEKKIPVDSLVNLLAEKYPETVEPHLYKAYDAKKVADVDGAIYEFEKVIEVDPDYVLAYNELGYLYSHKKQFDKAIENLDKYIEGAPGQPNPYDSLGEIFLQKGDFRKALDAFNKALALAPELETEPGFLASAIHLHIARAYMFLGQFDDAVSNFKLASELKGTSQKMIVGALINPVMIRIFEGRLDLAEKNLESLNELDKNLFTTPYKHFARGLYFIYAGDMKAAQIEADSLADKIYRCSVKSSEPTTRYQVIKATLLAEMKMAEGDNAGAVRIYEEIRKSASPNEIDVFQKWRYANALRNIGKVDEAEKILLQADEQTPNVHYIINELAKMYYDRREYKKALKEIDRFFRIMDRADGNIPFVKEMMELRESIETVS